MKAYLKEIAGVCEIENELIFHIASHTFAKTVILTKVVPIESLGVILGHKKMRITQPYPKVLDKKVSEYITILRDKFTGKKTKKSKQWLIVSSEYFKT